MCSGNCEDFSHKKRHHGCYRLLLAIKFIIFALTLGAILGLVGLYILDHDRFMKERARKMFRNVEKFTRGMQHKMQS